MTDIFEGSIIRAARRLDEFLNQVLRFEVCGCSHGCYEKKASSFDIISATTVDKVTLCTLLIKI